MKKRILSLVIICVMMLGLLPTVALADTPTSGTLGDNLNWVFADDTGTLTISGTGDMINKSTMTPFLSFRDEILKVVIEDGVTSICDFAFDTCESLTSVTISGSVTSIGFRAFAYCNRLTSITVPESVTSIGDNAFEGCTGLKDNNGFVIVKNVLYDYFGNASDVVIPQGVTAIDSSALQYSRSIKSIIIPDSVTSIATYAFYNCTNLTSVTLSNSITSIGSSTFEGCASLTSITIPNSVKSIGYSAFLGCTSLTSITIPDSVTSIGYSAFLGCTGLTSIIIPDSVTSIDDNVFDGCTGLQDDNGFIIVKNTLYDYLGNASDVVIPQGVTIIGNQAFSMCTCLVSVTIPDGVTKINNYAFEVCKNLTSVTMPKSVTSIGASAFQVCNNLTTVNYGGNENDKANIVVDSYNQALLKANWVYNYGKEPELHEHCYDNACDTTCNGCDEIREAPHEYGDYISDNNATTEADGTKTRECSECGNKDTVTDVGSKIPTPAELTEIFSKASNSYFSVFLFEEPFSNEYRLAAYILSRYYQEIAEYEDPDAPRVYNVPCDVFEALVSKTFETTDNDIATLKESEIYCDNNGNPYYIVSMIEGLSDESPLYYGYKNNGNNQYTLYAVWFGEGVEETEELEGEDGVDYVKYYGYKLPIGFGYALNVTYANGNVQYKGYTVIEETEKLYEIAKTEGYVRYNGTVVAPHTHSYTNACDTTCNGCDFTREITHKYGAYVSDNNATSEKDGTKTRTCSVCGHKETVADVGSKLPEQKPVEIVDTTKVFTDVKAKQWYTNAVNYAYSHGFIAGVSKTEFGRNVPVTRGMFITILARIAGVNTSGNANKVQTKFSDVKSGKYYTNAIKWASENGVVNGLTETEFGPNAAIERQQLCVMIVNFAEYMGIELKASQAEIKFTDASSIRKYAKTAVATCQKAGIVSGYAVDGGVEFRPLNTATRAEAAQILYKFHKDFVA